MGKMQPFRFVLLFILLGIFAVKGFTQASSASHPKVLYSKKYVSGDKPNATVFNINNISGWISWDGLSGIDPIADDAGVWYPRGTATTVYADGLVWGGYVNDPDTSLPSLRVNGQTYGSGTVPGRIILPGIAQSPEDPEVRIYRIRRDWQTVSDEELRQDAAELRDLDPSQVTQAQIDSVRMQYQKDWEEWPTGYGAPFYDLNGNGIYEPDQGETPGLQNADQVIWLVVNDLDVPTTYSLYGSPPIGLELQITIWGYNSSGPMGQAVFQRYRLINKSGFRIDSMFVARWSETDVGSYVDDLAGCDSLLDLGYAYNGFANDAEYAKFNLPPAAIGYLLLQGPVVASPGDSALCNFKKIPGYKNLPMTAFPYAASGLPNDHATMGDYIGTLEWYNQLNGFMASDTSYHEPYLHFGGPYLYRPTKYPVNGDPLTGIGDVDGKDINEPPGSRQVRVCSGPFTMQPGDTQEVVFALVGGIDSTGDNLSAVAELKRNAEFLRNSYPTPALRPALLPPEISSTGNSTQLNMRVNLQGFPDIVRCDMNFTPETGNESPFSLQLFDDGQHGDGAAGDQVWGNILQVDNRQYPYKGDLVIQHSADQETFENVATNLRLRPLPRPTNLRVNWENGRQDRQINFDEKVHLGFDVLNTDQKNKIDQLELINPLPDIYWQKISYTGGIAAGQTAASDSFYFELYAPASGDSLSFRYRIRFDHHTALIDLKYPLVPWVPDQIQGDTLMVVAEKGWASNLVPIVADPTKLTGHDYAVSFFMKNADSTTYWRLTDLSESKTKLDSILLPTQHYYFYSSVSSDNPVVDGIEWNVHQPRPGLAAVVEVANRNGPLPPEEWDEAGAPFGGNNVWHSLSSPSDLNRFYVSAGGGGGTIERIERQIENAGQHDFEIRFTSRGGIYQWWYDDDTWAYVPFEAWDVGIDTYHDTTDDVRCLTGGYSGGTATGPNGYTFDYTDPYWSFPATDWLYLRVPLDSLGTYDKFYQDVTSGMLNNNWWSHSKEVLGRITFCDFSGNGAFPEPGTVVRFITRKQNIPGDSLLVKAPTARRDSLYGIAHNFVLEQNYPNPFNSGTTIRYSLAKDAKIKLEVFNVLGQRVKTLLNGHKRRGEYLIHWNGENERGVKLASGIYFYRLQAGSYVKTRKIVLLK